MESKESCCPKGSWGSLPVDPKDALYEPKGKEIKLRDGELALHVYYVSSEPSSSDGKIIMVFTDVFGFSSRTKCICDELATDLNCTVIMPDVLRGETVDGENGRKTRPEVFVWLAKSTFDPLILGDVDACIDFLASKNLFTSSSSIACIGFCWGAWVVAKLLSFSSSLPSNKWSNILKCGVGLHPSTAIEKNVFKADEDQMLLDITSPLLLLTAGNDPVNLKQGSHLVTHFESKGGTSVDYPDMVHGWVSHGDLSVEKVSRDANDALSKTTNFLQKHL